MAVTSTTVGGINCWQFSGVVTDAELKTAWSSLIVNGVYVINRAIYLDDTADLTGCSGGFLVDFGTQVNPAIILNTTRDKTKSTFRNFTFLQRTGLTVTQRIRFVLTWDGVNLGTPTGSDGLSQNGGGMIYGVQGNPGGGDPRYLNEMSFAGLEGVTIYSQEFTEQELQPVVGQTSVLKGITFEKCFGFPQIGTPVAPVNVVVYRSNQNTQHPTQFPIRIYPALNRYASLCYVDSYVTRNNVDITTRLVDAFGSNASNVASLMILNNYTRESWFGATKTNFQAVTWATTNIVIGGVLKKLQFIGGDNAVIRAYDSRSTTASQKCKFLESGSSDFLDPSLTPTTDAEGKITLVHVGATASGTTTLPPIMRYTGQKFTFQKFGYRVSVIDIDMTQGGDNDLSAFTPVIPVVQEGLIRTQANINSATVITNFQDLLEELHVLAIGLSGQTSYDGVYGGNLFSYSGSVLNTSFTNVVIDATATSKIQYNSSTDTLTIKSSSLASNLSVSEWRNISGRITTINGATITSVYADLDGQRVNVKNLDPEGFGETWFLRYKLQSGANWTNINGTGNNTLITLASGIYDVQIRSQGYEWESDLVLDTNISLTLDAGLRYHVSANNTPQWNMSFNSTLSNAFQFDSVLNKVSVTNTTGAIIQPSFAELYRATQRIQHISSLVWTWTSPVTANATSQKILIPTGNPISMYLTDDSDASVKITCPVIHADSGESADDRVKGNADGFSIILGSPATAESAGLQSAIVSDLLAKLGGTGFVIDSHSLINIKTTLDTKANESTLKTTQALVASI